MKKVLLIYTGLLLTINAFGQSELNRRIDFSVEDMPVSDALISLCDKANLSISFQSRLLEDAKPITFQYRNKPIKFFFETCLKNTELGFKLERNRIVLYQKPPPIYTLSGFVEDSLSGERLVAATVYDNISGKGTTTNEYGFYSLSIPRGKAAVSFSYLGFNSKMYNIHIRKNLQFIVPLKSAITLKEIVVTDLKIGLQQGLSVEEGPNYTSGLLEKIPTIGGEPDIIRYFQTLSGVQSGAGSFGGMHVRGGEAGQNLVLLDGVPVYNSGHSLGLFSIFSDNIVKNARFFKGKFPSKYGGRLSSVVDIQTKEGNNKNFHFGGATSLFVNSLFAEGPIKKDKTSFFLSVRRSYLDPILNAFSTDEPENNEKINYHFFDINAKINHTFSEKDKIYVSFYTGADKLFTESSSYDEFLLEDETNSLSLNYQYDYFDTNWGNTIFSTRWNHLWSDKIFSNTTFTYSLFGFQLFSTSESQFEDFEQVLIRDISQYNFDSNIQDLAFKMDFDFIKSAKHHFKFGAGLLGRIFEPIFQFQEFDIQTFFEHDLTDGFYEEIPVQANNYFATEFNFYAEDDIKFSDKLNVQIGFHNAVFIAANNAWLSFQPRLSLQYQLNQNGTIYCAYSKMGQFLHVLSPAGVSMPFDLWVPSTGKAPPQRSNQVVFGTDWKLPLKFTFGAEAYYKKLDNLVTYQAGINTILNSLEGNLDWENQITHGEGWSYGIETSLRRKQGKTTGFINYTWSKADRKFDGLSNNERFPFSYNRQHDLKVGINHEFSPKFNIFATWTYGSGQFTTPRIIEVYGGGTKLDFIELDLEGGEGPLNTFQLPAFHHLDLNVSWNWPKKRVTHFFSFGAKNIYNRKNHLFAVRYTNLESLDEEPSGIEGFIGLPILPSLRYSIKF